MGGEPRANLIALADIDELAAGQIGVRSYEQIDARARRLLPLDQIGSAVREATAARTDDTPSSAVITPEGEPSTR